MDRCEVANPRNRPWVRKVGRFSWAAGYGTTTYQRHFISEKKATKYALKLAAAFTTPLKQKYVG